ncbi:MAG TPA: GAF domain-containing protein [Edaphobacter sp.]|nr:GAF domain-containing protein [Edaphobacter sp.]
MTPSPDNPIADLAASLLAAPDSPARATLIASAVVQVMPDCACIVHRIISDRSPSLWSAIGKAGEISVRQISQSTPSRLSAALLSAESRGHIYSASDIRREDYAHVNVSRSIASIAYLPLRNKNSIIGAIEIFTFSVELQLQDLESLAPLLVLASPALLAAENFEEQRQNLLNSIHRMTQLYDLEKSLNATLDLDAVIALIPVKVKTMIACQAIHLWLFDGGTVRLVSSRGTDPTVRPGMMQAAGEGYVADMAEEGEPLLIGDPNDHRLHQRNGDAESSSQVKNVLLVPLLQDESEVGVLEAVNKDGGSFDEDDLFFLSTIAETVSSALKNASLMFAERKLEILEALVRVSSEITSTLRLDRLLQIIVNSPQSVLPFELCAIALDNRGRLQLKAVSGMSSLPFGDARVEWLHDLIRWISSHDDAQHFRQYDEADIDAPEELPAEVISHFEATGYRALYSLPLIDDQGRVGLLLYESSDPNFLDLPQTEMIKIVAGQATVAIRNALLYREVPLISLLEPLVQRKQALLRTSRSRRLGLLAGIAAAVIFFVFCPLPMRVTGEAMVAPQHIVTVAAPVDGNVTQVFAHEGQRVVAGDVLGAMNDWQWRMDLASSEAKYQEAMLVMQTDLAHGYPQAGVDRSQTEYLRSEVARARSRLESAQLRSPISGIVITPALQNAAGGHLDAGASFAQVLDLSSAVVNIAFPQRDVALVRPGQSAAIKLDSYPQRSWHNSIAVISPEAQQADGEETFAARVPLPNGDGILRAGMTGRAKIFIGFRPAGYVLLRRPALWIWQILWNWIGW